jgi:hypothetical protein
MNNSEYIYIGLMILLVIYFIRRDGFIKGIYFSLFLFLIGTIVGLVQSGYFFGRIGEYIFLFFLILYGAFIYFKCPKELSKSLEGQGRCIKREWNKIIIYVKNFR